MKSAAGYLLIILLVPLTFAAAPAQEKDRPPGVDPDGSDSIGVSALDEQLTGPGGDDDLEREGDAGREYHRRQNWSVQWRGKTSAVLQEPAGYSRGTYAGDRMKIYQRLSVRKGSAFQFKMLMEKDPGETALTDFVSGAVSVGNLPGAVRMVAGDFRIRAGQGLLFGGARSFGKGAAVIEPTLRDGWGIPEGISSDEVNFFRGLAAGTGVGPVSVILFGSVRTLSAHISTEGDLRGIDESGYHRTATELDRRDRLTNRSFGGLFRVLAGDWLAAGVNVLRSSLSVRETGEGRPVPSTATTRRGSIDLRIGLPPFTLFGEVVLAGAEVPWIAGILFVPSEKTRIVIVRRFYPAMPEFRRTFGFADGSTGQNEAGTYLGAEISIYPGLIAAGYLDLFSSSAPEPGAFFPPVGIDRLISIRYIPSKRFGIETRYRSRTVEVAGNEVSGAGLPTPGNGVKREDKYRCEVHWKPAERLTCRFRLEYSVASPGTKGETDRGSMVFADLTLEPSRAVTIHSRLQLFGTDSYASRIYTMEADLPGTLTNAVLSGEGSRWYLICAWRLSEHVRFSMKYSRFRRDDLRKIGSGADELPSNIVEKAGFQLDLAF